MMRDEKRFWTKVNKEGGFSLVELMISLVIGLLILLGAGQLFVMSKQTYDQMSVLGNRQQSIRVIFDIISLDIRTAQNVGDNSGNQNILDLYYEGGVRNEDPYCPGATTLNHVKYTFDSGEQAIYVAVACGATATVSAGDQGEQLVDEIENMQFLLSSNHYDSAGAFSQDKGLSIEVDVTFPQMSVEEANGRRQFVFNVARRNNIL